MSQTCVLFQRGNNVDAGLTDLNDCFSSEWAGPKHPSPRLWIRGSTRRLRVKAMMRVLQQVVPALFTTIICPQKQKPCLGLFSHKNVSRFFRCHPSHVCQRAAEAGAGPAKRSQEDLGGERQPHKHQTPQRHAGDPEVQEALQFGDPVRRTLG